MMKLKGLAAALLAATTLQFSAGHSLAAGNCYSPSAIEAEEAIRFLTELMVVSTACQDTTYAEFRLRNKDAIIAYQKAMITHFHGAPAFDRWNTSLANVSASKQAGLNVTQVCTQSAALLQQGKTLDTPKYKAFAAQQAAAAGARYEKCGGGKTKK